jgi:CheY-like chemotaxis protein
MAIPSVRLLVVDDEPAILEVTSALLAAKGYDVSTAEDGLEAMGHLVEPLPDLVISDLRMPHMSGFELLALVRERFPQVPVIAMSGEFTEKELPPGLLADAFLQKGTFTLHHLCAKITELLSTPLRQVRL